MFAAVLGAALIALQGLGFRWDPLDLSEHRRRSAEARAAAAAADAAGRRLEVEGAAHQTRRIEAAHQQAVAVAGTTGQATLEARNSHDAEIPLDPDRAARLVSHDRELCRLAPDVCSAPAPDPAGGRHDALRPGTAAALAEPGRS